MLIQPFTMPAASWPISKWLCSPAEAMDPVAAAQLRMSMFRRLEAVLISAISTPCLAAFAASRHPGAQFKLWLVLEIGLAVFRIVTVLQIRACLKHQKIVGFSGRHGADLMAVLGTLWSALLGYGCLITYSTDDFGLIIILTFTAAGILAAQSIRNPSAPRLNALQMGLIIAGTILGLLYDPLQILHSLCFLSIVYYFTMLSITRQLHQDYAAMIVTQIENQRHANHCPLTGLHNRRYFRASMQRLLASHRDQSSALLSIDLDGFKSVNDSLGHQVGDRLLVEVATRLKKLAEPLSIVARLGGDEFAVILTPSHGSEANAVAARIVAALGEPFHVAQDSVVRIGASIGITMLDPTMTSADDDLIMMRADAALYEAKSAGKGTFRHSGIDRATKTVA